jgi:hypothetical protein
MDDNFGKTRSDANSHYSLLVENNALSALLDLSLLPALAQAHVAIEVSRRTQLLENELRRKTQRNH